MPTMASSVQHWQMPNVVLPHHAMGERHELLLTDRVRRGRHVLLDCRDGLAHASDLSNWRSSQNWPQIARLAQIFSCRTRSSCGHALSLGNCVQNYGTLGRWHVECSGATRRLNATSKNEAHSIGSGRDLPAVPRARFLLAGAQCVG